jgi:hypothetical protein
VTVFERLGRLAGRRPWLLVAAWVVILLVAVPLAPQVVGALRSGGFTLDDLESARARQVLEEELGLPPSFVVVVLRSEGDPVGSPAFEARAAEATAGLASAPHVLGITSHLMAPRQIAADGLPA